MPPKLPPVIAAVLGHFEWLSPLLTSRRIPTHLPGNPFTVCRTIRSNMRGFTHVLTASIGLPRRHMMATTTIWRLPEVLRQTGLSRSTIYEMISRGEFPRQVKLGRRAVGWIANDVDEWIHSKVVCQQEYDLIRGIPFWTSLS